MDKKYKNFIKIGCLAFVLPVLASCTGILDTSPRNVLTDASIWDSNDGITAYIAKMYDQLQTEDLNYTAGGDVAFPSVLTDEAIKSYTWGIGNEPIIPDNRFGWWSDTQGYPQIRTVNSFIRKIETAGVSDELKALYKAEARFIRAFHYFALVKRYGGVPLITVAQEYTGGNIEELKVPRDKEQVIYDFIYTELQDLVDTDALPETRSGNDLFRATKYAALALQSRAMLYAASIAKYSNITLPGGEVGISSTLADDYWEKARDAAFAIIDSGKFSLYGANTVQDQKAENFQNMFLDKTMHTEAIFTKAFSYPDKAHSFDFYNAAQSFKVDYGCATNPTVEMVESFDYVDGSSGELKVKDEFDEPIKYADPYDLFKDKDPRLLASVLLPGMPWQDGKLEIRRGIILPDNSRRTAPNATDSYGTGENSIPIAGKDGPIDVGDFTKSGFYIKKFMNPTDRVDYNRSDTYWMVFRYGEVLLNYAEAAMELGESSTGDALTYINMLRTRAGVQVYTDVDLAKVRKERKVELAFENHRWWDMVRWRIADTEMNNREFKALHPYLVWEEGKSPSEMSYIFEIVDSPKEPRTFLPKLYYHNVPAAQMATNNKLIPNPGY